MITKQKIEKLKQLYERKYTKDFDIFLEIEVKLYCVIKAIEGDSNDFEEIDVSTLPESLRRKAMRDWGKKNYITDETLEEIYDNQFKK